MKILILTQFFSPEIGATQARLHGFAAGLSERGHSVEVICGVPNHPQGVVHDGYHRTLIRRRRFDGFGTTYVRTYTSPQKDMLRRLAYYGTYAALASAAGSLRERPDVVLASSPPLPVAIAGAEISRVRRAPWVMDVRDLWPAAGVAMGKLSSGSRVLRAAEQLERWLYRDADAITTVAEPFSRRIESLVGRGKVTVVRNGTTRFWLEKPTSPRGRSDLGLAGGEFVWTYAGNLGGAQDLPTAIAAAALLGDGFRLFVLGDGPEGPALERLAGQTGARVAFRGQVPPESARDLLHASDALLVPLAADPSFDDYVPSKLFDYCATGRPVICAAGAEARRLAEAAGATTAPPGDPEALAAAVRTVQAGTATHQPTSMRRFAAANLREAQLTRIEEVLHQVTGREQRARSAH